MQDIDLQFIFNIILGVTIAGGGWFARQLWDAVAELRRDIHNLEVTLPTRYVPKTEFAEGLKEVKDLLNKVIDKLDGKADK